MGARGRQLSSWDDPTVSPDTRSGGMMKTYEAKLREDEQHAAMIQQQANQRDSGMTQQATIGFQGYIVETSDPFAGFHHIVIAYCLMAFVLMYPFVVCVHHVRENRKRRRATKLQPVGGKQQHEGELVSPPASEILHDFAPPKQAAPNGKAPPENGRTHTSIVLPPECRSACSAPSPPYGDQEPPTNQPIPVTPTTTKSTFQEDPDKPLSDSMPHMPDAERVAARTHVLLSAQAPSSRSSQPVPSNIQSRQASQVASSSGILSRIPSAATTGRLHSGTGRGSAAAWPRHRHSRRPSGDPSWQWRRAIQTERRHTHRRMERILAQQEGMNPNNNIESSGVLFRLKSSAVGMMSDLANSVLTAEEKEQQANPNHQRSSKVSPHQQSRVEPLDSALYSRKAMAVRQRQPSKTQQRRPSASGSARSGSLRSWNDGRYGYPSSVMSSIVDDISPNDAADADDPGKVRVFPGSPASSSNPHHHAHRSPMAGACCMAFEPWLDVAEPNDEWKRLMGLSFPVTIGALVEPVARCALMGILSQRVGTNAMVAFLLVNLLYRMTGETLSVAITDAESTLVQMALTSTASSNNNSPANSPTFTREGYRLAGQYVQLGCIFQILIIGTILLLWHTWIEDVVLWWVDSAEMASLAKEYFQIILILFLTQAVYRAIMVPCNMRGSEHSTVESFMDIVVTVVTLITISVVLSKTADIPSEYPEHYSPAIYQESQETYSVQSRMEDSQTALVTTAWIQVNIGIAACVLKVMFCVVKGWLDQFWGGLLRSVALLNFEAFCNLLLTSIPLILGALLELGEVDLLTLFVQALGPAEVATWAMFGCLWDLLESATEGISEAAAIRVAFHLSASQPMLAKKLAHKALFWTVVQALILTSILLLGGRHLIVALTVDYTLQHLLDQLIGLMALANLSMAFAHVCWSLVGAQGRFNLATLVMLVCRWMVTMPMALIFIFAMNYDEETLAGAVAVGTATSACILAAILFSSNWDDVAQELYLQGLLSCDEDDDFDFSFGDDEDSDSDDDSFGVGGSGYPSNKKSVDDFDDDDDSGDLPRSTEQTTHTGTNTGSGVNSGADSGVISGLSGS